jgi:hypothetical protein
MHFVSTDHLPDPILGTQPKVSYVGNVCLGYNSRRQVVIGMSGMNIKTNTYLLDPRIQDSWTHMRLTCTISGLLLNKIKI